MISDLVELVRDRRSNAAMLVELRGGRERRLSFADLDWRSDVLARGLASFGDLRGTTVPIALQSPLDFATAFFGVAKAGAVPVPAPSHAAVHPGHRRRLEQIIDASVDGVALVDPSVFAVFSGHARIRFATFPALEEKTAEKYAGAWPAVSDVAYYQYSSGSLGAPHPIVLSQDNVLAQLAQAAEAFNETSSSVSVNWVPLFHDMGLVTSLLRPLWSGYTSVILDPFEFVRDPTVWPRELTRWRATHTSAPDFGFALCAAKTQSLEGLDLSALAVARSAGEMVRPSTLESFSERFHAVGFRSSSFAPSFGLAEATLTATTTAVADEPRVVAFSAAELRHDRAIPARDGVEQVRLVSSGAPLRGTRVEIVDSSGHVLRAGKIGEIRITGRQVAGGVVDTGDIGFILKGELFPLGRARERFQIAGVNFYSGEIERAITDAVPQLRPGRAAVFVAFAEVTGSKLVVQCERRADAELEAPAEDTVRRRIRSLLAEQFGLRVHVIDVVPPRTLPVTTSGKLRRGECRRRFELSRATQGDPDR
ncbi:AMP-binding protein [Microbacterium sp. A8/3-1]|uniref:AMP-binding protein n=1 Tax=Microbacterium sp. A8/3-1 TaxID=3160749 RepID=A0AAU7W1D0_9MICO